MQIFWRFQPTYEGLKPSSSITSTGDVTGFQHTYEGLKLCLSWPLQRVVDGFQHTYEGLKPVLPVIGSRRAYSFQHTYEGLKHEFVDTINFAVQSVFSIPMRDWNTNGPEEIQDFADPFSAYLWGIETTTHSNTPAPARRVFSIPMRDWNQSWGQGFSKVWQVFSIPMRDWNHNCQK